MDSKITYEFLRGHHLFNDLSDEDLGQLLPLFNYITLQKDEVLYREGFPARNFFLIVTGTIALLKEGELQTQLQSRQHFGEQDLETDQLRSQTARATESAQLLAINKKGFRAVLQAYPGLNRKLEAIQVSRKIQQSQSFPWIAADENIRFINRKHINTFYGSLGFPILFLLIAVLGSFFLGLNLLVFVPITAVLFGSWVLWHWLDWQNDYYIVTEERVAWVEKLLWLHDQRREIPLPSVLSANLATNQIQRVFGYGDVIIRTYTGNMPMRNAAHPDVLLDLILETQQMVQERSRQTELNEIGETIRTRLGFSGSDPEHESDPLPPPQEHIPGGPQVTETISPLQEFLNLFRARFELNEVITYRKHKFILFRNTWWLWALAGLEITAFFARLVNLISFPSLTAVLILLAITLAALGYSFADWANDRYQITPKQIIDLDRKPFGKETKRSAMLENILSLDYRRENILQRLFDFGTVAINVGDIQLDFEYVAHPKAVQNEIFERYNGAVKRLEEQESQRRRDDMVEFLAAYHQESHTDPDQDADLPPAAGRMTGQSEEQD